MKIGPTRRSPSLLNAIMTNWISIDALPTVIRPYVFRVVVLLFHLCGFLFYMFSMCSTFMSDHLFLSFNPLKLHLKRLYN